MVNWKWTLRGPCSPLIWESIWGSGSGKARPDLLPTSGGGWWSCPVNTTEREEEAQKECDPTWPMTHSFQVPAHSSCLSSCLWSWALPVPTSWVCTKHTILSIFAACVLIHPSVSCPKIYTAAIPTFIYFMNDFIPLFCLSYWPPLLVIYSVKLIHLKNNYLSQMPATPSFTVALPIIFGLHIDSTQFAPASASHAT